MVQPKLRPKIQALAVTLRPANGILNEDIEKFVKYVKMYCDYWYIVAEKTDEQRHIHAGLYLKKKWTVSKINETLRGKFKKSFEERGSIMGVAFVGKPMYDSNFVDQYLIAENKEGEKSEEVSEVIDDTLPVESIREQYYMEKIEKAKRQGGDAYYLKLEKLYYEMIPQGQLAPSKEPTLQEIEHFLCVMMFKERRIRVISDSRKMRRLCHCLQKFICKATGYCWAKGDVESQFDGMHTPWSA